MDNVSAGAIDNQEVEIRGQMHAKLTSFEGAAANKIEITNFTAKSHELLNLLLMKPVFGEAGGESKKERGSVIQHRVRHKGHQNKQKPT